MAAYIEQQRSNTEHTNGLWLGMAWYTAASHSVSILSVVLCCVAVLAIMCVDELNWIFESISTVVGDCGNNSRLKRIRHSVRTELWPLGGFFLHAHTGQGICMESVLQEIRRG